MPVRIGTQKFSGASNVFNGELSGALRELAIANAKRVLVTASVAALTDNGGGAAADGTVGAIPDIAAFTEVGTASAQKAEFEASLASVKDGLTELAAKVVVLKAVIPATDLTQAIGGAAADGTIAAIDMSMTAVATSIASYTNTKDIVTNIRNYIHTLVIETNRLRVAVGLTPLVNNVGGSHISPPVLGALAVSTGTAVDGTALSGISKVGADAFLAAVGAAIKELSTGINAVSAVTAPATTTVVAAA